MIEKTIEKLLQYAKCHLYLADEDIVFKRNELLHEFNLKEPYLGDEIDTKEIEEMETPIVLIEKLKTDVPKITDEEIERVMSIISPSPSIVVQKFNALKEKGSKEACAFLYDLMIKNNYIKEDDIKKNKYWRYEGENNFLEITINLAKPEKDNKEIERLSKIISSSYPKCSLCYENVGLYGGDGKPARSNIRVIPFKLSNEDWFMQYSPYSYYNEHAIIINKEHVPMLIDKKTVLRLFDFLDQYPSYFIGSNSDLPRVGGSMLFHEHFQGGAHLMPLMYARDRYNLKRRDTDNVSITYLDWYNSTFLLSGKNQEALANMAEFIIKVWEEYSDESVAIVSNDSLGRHSTVTPIARKIGDTYYLYIILRNNRTSEEYPDGIFHAHKEYHNIKKEGIGLIEAMGLFILPGRLVKELDLIASILSSPDYTIREILINNPSLEKHLDFINYLVIKYSRRNDPEAAKEIIKFEVGKVCENILKNTGVFKDTIEGQSALFRFFKRLSFEVTDDEQS